MLASAFKTCDGMVPALTGTGSKPPAASTVLHSCGSFAIVWHIADVQTALMNVRFEGNNGHDADVTRCLLMILSGTLDFLG